MKKLILILFIILLCVFQSAEGFKYNNIAISKINNCTISKWNGISVGGGEPSPAWVSPTSTTDGGGTWTNDDNSWDGDTGTFASSAANNNTDYLELNIAAISCSKVQIYADMYKTGVEDIACSIDVYYSLDWHNIFSGTITANTWTEKTIGSTQTVTAARVKPNSLSAAKYMRLKEFQFWDTDT